MPESNPGCLFFGGVTEREGRHEKRKKREVEPLRTTSTVHTARLGRRQRPIPEYENQQVPDVEGVVEDIEGLVEDVAVEKLSRSLWELIKELIRTDS